MADTEDSREKRRVYEREWRRAWRAANREEYNAKAREWRSANPEKARERDRDLYAANPEKARERMVKWQTKNATRVAYNAHKMGAKRRNIAFLLTFDEWLTIWSESGKLSQRGRGSNQYCMARFGDAGPYEISNVRICTNWENTLEGNLGKQVSEITRARLSMAHLGRPRGPHSDETRKRMSIAAKARVAKPRHLRPP